MKLTVFLLSYHNRQEMSALSSALEGITHCFVTNITQVQLPAKILFVQNCHHSPLQSKFLSQLEEEAVNLQHSLAGFYWQGGGAEDLITLATGINEHGCGLLSQPVIGKGSELPLIAERLLGLGFRGYLPRSPKPPVLLTVAPQYTPDSPYATVSNCFDLWEGLLQRLSPFMDCRFLDLKADSPLFPYVGCEMSQETLLQLASADALLLLCPSFYHSIPPSLLGFLQKLCQLPLPFQDKAVFTILVSDKRGGTIPLQQLISMLSLENSFYLPPRFALTEQASRPMECLTRAHLDEELDRFSQQMLELLSQGNLV